MSTVTAWIFMISFVVFIIAVICAMVQSIRKVSAKGYIIVIVISLVVTVVFFFATGVLASKEEEQAIAEQKAESARTEKESVQKEPESKDVEIEDEPVEPELDEDDLKRREAFDVLAKVYADCPVEGSFDDMISYLDETGLPYSNDRYTGDRTIQVSTEDEGTIQSHNRSNLPYIEINYHYTGTNNMYDEDMSLYEFTGMEIVSKFGSTYGVDETGKGKIDGENGTFTRSEQIESYYKNQERE